PVPTGKRRAEARFVEVFGCRLEILVGGRDNAGERVERDIEPGIEVALDAHPIELGEDEAGNAKGDDAPGERGDGEPDAERAAAPYRRLSHHSTGSPVHARSR